MSTEYDLYVPQELMDPWESKELEQDPPTPEQRAKFKWPLPSWVMLQPPQSPGTISGDDDQGQQQDGSGGRPDGEGGRGRGSNLVHFSEVPAGNEGRFLDALHGNARSAFISDPSEDLASRQLFQSDDGHTGVAVTEDGELANLFRNEGAVPGSGGQAGTTRLRTARYDFWR